MQLDTMSARTPVDTSPRSSADLCELAAGGLMQMFDAKRSLFCDIYNQTQMGMRQEGISHRYTMMALLGLHRYERSGKHSPIRSAPILDSLLCDLGWVGNRGDLGLLLWTCVELAPERVPEVYAKVLSSGELGTFRDGREGWTMEVAWFLTGLASCYLAGYADLPRLAENVKAARQILESNCGPCGVFCHLSRHKSIAGYLRGRIGTFADQVYPIIAFARLSQALDDEKARKMALLSAERMCALQGSLGEWSWHYDSVSGRVVSRYPVYSVHQHAMGPMMLFAVEEATGNSFDSAIQKSVSWISGNNELHQDFVEPSFGLVWRCIHLNSMDAFVDGGLRFLQLRDAASDASRLKVRHECRPYELGWLLYAFAGQEAKSNLEAMSESPLASSVAVSLPETTEPDETYVLITAAHNEEAFIEATIQSVLSQTIRPLKWVIVSDASTDRTNEILAKYSGEYAFIELVCIDGEHRHDFGAKARAVITGSNRLINLKYAFIGILDADITVEPAYFDQLLGQFRKNPKLGLAGGFILERKEGVFISRQFNRPWSVAGATQFFRRKCFEEIGGIPPLKYGGEDWCAEVNSRMKGWTVQAIPDLKVFHHRATGTATNLLGARFQQGRMAHSLGCLPIFEAAKCIGRATERPYLIGGMARFAGFLWASFSREGRFVSREFVRFMRTEQMHRLLSALHG
jgi:poly-beta-1,6-N-acetyl-D-glucosamine synthase